MSTIIRRLDIQCDSCPDRMKFKTPEECLEAQHKRYYVEVKPGVHECKNCRRRRSMKYRRA